MLKDHDDLEDNRDYKSCSYFAHTQCQYFPCHKNVLTSDFNCLFCFCPLYFLGEDCGGDLVWLPNGVKDCSYCIIPHQRENYGSVIQQLRNTGGICK